jgi:hypothetical protein
MAFIEVAVKNLLELFLLVMGFSLSVHHISIKSYKAQQTRDVPPRLTQTILRSVYLVRLCDLYDLTTIGD